MKIAILSLYSGHIDRGVETWTREMATRLAKDHNVLVLQGDGSQEKSKYKIKVHKVKILWKLRPGETFLSQLLAGPYWLSLGFSFAIRALRSLISFKPDIVMPSNGEAQVLVIKLASKLFGWKVIVTGHAGIGAPDKWNLLMRPDCFVSPSKRGAEWAKNLYISKGIRITNIPHGVDLEKFKPNLEKMTLKLEKPVILCVSSFDPFKRVELAVKAIAKLKRGSLLVIGGDRESGRIDRIASSLLGSSRYKKIRVKPGKIPRYYSSSNLFTLPSNEHEAFGIVYLEALASGLPLVATNDELRREIVGDAGILVDPTDIDAYTNALQKALDTDWGGKPRKQAEKFSWDKVVEKYEKLFEDLVK